MGLGWSKDNLRTADRCYVDGLFPNGTVKWPCGAVNHGEGTSGQFKMQLQQTMLAALSLGPVGISDQLSARPTGGEKACADERPRGIVVRFQPPSMPRYMVRTDSRYEVFAIGM